MKYNVCRKFTIKKIRSQRKLSNPLFYWRAQQDSNLRPSDS